MQRKHWLIGLVVLSSCSVSWGQMDLVLYQKQTAQQTRATFERIAGQIKSLIVSHWHHERALRDLNSQAREAEFKMRRQILGTHHQTDSIRQLIKHKDPKVRTLAMVALFKRYDPQLLPVIHTLVGDNAATLAAIRHTPNSPLVPYDGGVHPPKQDQTVGSFAMQLLNIYLRQVGMRIDPDHDDFEAYWKPRAKRDHCISWWRVRLEAASQNTMPMRQSRQSHVDTLYQKLLKLPAVQRELTILLLFHDRRYRTDHVDQQKLLYAARRLGTDRLLDLLAGKLLIDDPDLEAWQKRHGPYLGARRFIIDHATDLFEAKHAEPIAHTYHAQIQVKDPSYKLPQYAFTIAAAQLVPDRFADKLPKALTDLTKPYQDRGRFKLAKTMWQLNGLGRKQELLDWYYGEKPGRGMAYSPRSWFTDLLTQRFGSADRKMLAALVADERFKTVRWRSLEPLIRGLNHNLLEPIWTEKQLEFSYYTHVSEVDYELDHDPKQNRHPDYVKRCAAAREAIRNSLKRWQAK